MLPLFPVAQSSIKHAKHIPSDLIKDLTTDSSIHTSSKSLEEIGLEYREARRGLLLSPPTPSDDGILQIGGLLNHNGTSCYMGRWGDVLAIKPSFLTPTLIHPPSSVP